MMEDEYKISKHKLSVIAAYNKGYRIIDGECYSPKGQKLKPYIQQYYKRYCNPSFFGHFLAAYQKFGDAWAYSGLDVRHMDGDCLNNKEENIEIGTHQQNILDIPIPTRVRSANNPKLIENRAKGIKEKLRKFPDHQILEIRKQFYIEELTKSHIADYTT
jgi:HNH endonuclease